MNAPVEPVVKVFRAEVTIPPETAIAITNGAGAVALAQEWTIDCAEMAELAADEVRSLEARAEALDKGRKSITEPLRVALTNANGIFMPTYKALIEAAGVIRTKLLTWRRAEEARIAEEKRKAEEIARKARHEAEEKAAAERARAEALAAEERRKALEAVAARDRALVDGNAEEAARLAGQAAAAAQAAESVLARGAASAEAALIEASAAAPVVVAAPAMPSGTGSRQKWEGRLKDEPDAFLRAVLDIAVNKNGLIHLLKFDWSAVNKHAAATKGAMPVDGMIFEDVGTLTISKKGA